MEPVRFLQLFCVCFLNNLMTANCQSNLTSLRLTSDLPEVFDGRSAVVSEDNFMLTLTIGVIENCAAERARVVITLPSRSYITQSDCKNTITGRVCDAHSPRTDVCAKLPSISDINVSADAGVFIEKNNAFSFSQTSVTIDLGMVVCNDTILTPSEVNITLITQLKEDACGSRRSFYEFTGSVDIDSGVNVTSIEIAALGPLLTSSTSADPATLASGENSTISIHVLHAPYSTEDVTNLEITVAPESTNFSEVVAGSVNIAIDGNPESPASLPNVVTGLSFTNTSSIVITFVMRGASKVLLHSGVGVNIQLTYTSSTNSSKTFTVHRSYSLPTPSFDFTNCDANSVNLNPITAGTNNNQVQCNLQGPRGFFSLDLVITQDGPGPNPTMTIAPFTLAVTEAVTGRRKRHLDRVRRAVSSNTFNLGSVQNPYTSANIAIQGSYSVLSATVGFSLPLQAYLVINSQSIVYLILGPVTVTVPVLVITKTAQIIDGPEKPKIVNFVLTVQHHSTSNGPAFDVKLHGGSQSFDILWASSSHVGPTPSDPALSVVDNKIFTWTLATLAVGNTMTMSYSAIGSDDGLDIPEGLSYINASVTYKSASGSFYTYVQNGPCCVERDDIMTSSLFLNHGFTVLALLAGILLGLIIIVVVIIIMIKVCRRIPCGSQTDVSSVKVIHAQNALGESLITQQIAIRKGQATVQDSTAGDSIIHSIGMSDKILGQRELDNRDIQKTISVDMEIEDERDKSMINATLMLMKGLQNNGDIPSETVEKCAKKFKKGLQDLDKNTERDFCKELEDIYKGLSHKNNEKLANLLAQHEEEDEEMKEKTKDLSPEERDEMTKLMKQQQTTERNELTYILKLEQDEESEKLRKEYSIRQRMGIKELQQDLLSDVKTEGNLHTEQADWLMKEYFKNQTYLETLYDDEISRQRMILEEKLARRRALAQKTEMQEEHQAEMLNTIATQQLQTINKMKKEGVLTPDGAQILIDETQKEMVERKKKMDAERSHQEEELHKKLSERKKKRLEEQAKKHQQEKDEQEKKQKAKEQEGYVDPSTLLHEKYNLNCLQRSEMNDIENQIDQEHAEELLKRRKDLCDETKIDLENSNEKLFSKLKIEGMSEDQVEKIIRKHNKDMDKLQETQEDERLRQDEAFKKTLARRRKDWSSRREEEKKEQEQLREHEANVVRKMMDNQVAMSEEERDRIMQEHEKHMVKLENSLTLNKLQQKRMLEERLAKKRAQQLEKLQKKQQQETKKVVKQIDNDSELDDDDRHVAELELMKKHAKQRCDAMREQIETEDQEELVRVEMMKERASALQEQEVRLGAMLASLQMEKAKEMAKIEEQQKAIHNLKSNLMDDLNDKGILSDPECQRVVQIHQKEQEKLQEKLDAQRAKQENRLQSRLQQRLAEKEGLLTIQQRMELDELNTEDEVLRKRLQERLAQKEANLSKMQEAQMTSAMAEGNSPAAKIRRVAMKHKHMLEMETFRNRMEKEISQTLEEVRRQNELRRMQNIQDQELQFINGLVRLGKFQMEELENVLVMLFPTKTVEERRAILDKLVEGYKPREDAMAKQHPGLERRASTLEDRVKSAAATRGRRASLMGQRTKPVGSGKKRQGLLRSTGDEGRSGRRPTPIRPDPVGRSDSPEYSSDLEGVGPGSRRPHPARLPPVRSARNKKKTIPKKNTFDYDENDGYFD